MARSNVTKLDTPKQPMVARYADEIKAAKQISDDARMGVTGIYKRAGDDGLHTAALKQAIKLSRTDEVTKAQAHLGNLCDYLKELGFLAPESRIVFAQASILETEPAA